MIKKYLFITCLLGSLLDASTMHDAAWHDASCACGHHSKQNTLGDGIVGLKTVFSEDEVHPKSPLIPTKGGEDAKKLSVVETTRFNTPTRPNRDANSANPEYRVKQSVFDTGINPIRTPHSPIALAGKTDEPILRTPISINDSLTFQRVTRDNIHYYAAYCLCARGCRGDPEIDNNTINSKAEKLLHTTTQGLPWGLYVVRERKDTIGFFSLESCAPAKGIISSSIIMRIDRNDRIRDTLCFMIHYLSRQIRERGFPFNTLAVKASMKDRVRIDALREIGFTPDGLSADATIINLEASYNAYARQTIIEKSMQSSRLGKVYLHHPNGAQPEHWLSVFRENNQQLRSLFEYVFDTDEINQPHQVKGSPPLNSKL